MPKIKQVRVRNMIKAVALEDFVNLATGITVKKLTDVKCIEHGAEHLERKSHIAVAVEQFQRTHKQERS